MSILAWVAVLAAAWFGASVVTALIMGRYLRRAAEGVAIDPDALRPLDTGPMRLWLDESATVPAPRRPVEPPRPDPSRPDPSRPDTVREPA